MVILPIFTCDIIYHGKKCICMNLILLTYLFNGTVSKTEGYIKSIENNQKPIIVLNYVTKGVLSRLCIVIHHHHFL